MVGDFEILPTNIKTGIQLVKTYFDIRWQKCDHICDSNMLALLNDVSYLDYPDSLEQQQ